MTAQEFDTAIIEFQPQLLRYARSLTNDRDTAMDLVQDSYEKALRYREKYQPDTNLKAWLLTILKNSFINDYNGRKMHATIVDKTLDLYFLNLTTNTGPLSPESTYMAQELQIIINTIPPRWLTSFQMYMDGWKYEEIAERLNVKLGTVKSNIYYARRYAQDIINES